MNCKKCQELIFEYFDKSLIQKKEKKVYGHLKVCKDCFELYKKEERFSKFLKNAMDYRTPSLVIDDSIVDRLKNEKEERKFLSLAHRKLYFILRPISILILLFTASLVFLVLQFSEKDKGYVISPIEEREVLNYEEGLLLTDPKTDWIERRLLITVIDKKRNSVEKIITSKFPEKIIKYGKINGGKK